MTNQTNQTVHQNNTSYLGRKNSQTSDLNNSESSIKVDFKSNLDVKELGRDNREKDIVKEKSTGLLNNYISKYGLKNNTNSAYGSVSGNLALQNKNNTGSTYKEYNDYKKKKVLF